MQKKIIALAIAGLASTAAFAQSNVTVYGIVDMYAAGVNGGPNHASAINSGGLAGSRIGFKGVEDLGGGTKALFTLEYALGVDQSAGYTTSSSTATGGGAALTGTASGGNGTLGVTNTQPTVTTTGTNGSGIGAARQAFVGLTGDFGTVIAGRLQTLAYNFGAAYNPTFGTAVDTFSAAATGAGTAIGTAERLDNAIAYVAPTFAGVTLAAAHTSNAATTTAALGGENVYSSATRASEVSATYANGPLSVGGVYRHAQVADSAVDQNGFGLGASYDFGVAKLFVATANQRAAKQSDAAQVYNVGAVAPVSANGAVIVSYARGDVAKSDKDATALTVAYKHSLSKRTALYAGVAQNTGYGLTPSIAGVSGVANGNTDAKVTGAIAGINHSF